MNESPRVRCTLCKGPARKRIGPGAGILFKGSGFYQTDYRSSGYVSAAKADQSAATSGSTEGKPSSESKSGSAPESKPSSKPSPQGATPKT